MRVVVDVDADTFAGRAGPWLAGHPVAGNVLATTLEGVRQGQRNYSEALWLSMLDDAERVIGAAMHTPPHHLFVCPMPDQAIGLLAEELAGIRPALSGVNGVREAAEAFVRHWQRLRPARATPAMAARIYQLEQVVAPAAAVPGRLRIAGSADIELTAGWMTAFHLEALGAGPAEDVTATARRRIAAGEAHLWTVGEESVSLACVSAPAAGVARVGPVYTPPEHRRRGYAGAGVAAVSQLALDGGAEHCMLYTDLSNQTSNSIYQALGYRAAFDAQEYVFGYDRDR